MSTMHNGNTKNVYQNPEKKPLEKLELLVHKDDVVRTIAALSPEWREERTFLEYQPPNIYDSEGKEILGAKDHWLKLVSEIKDDLHWLSHLRFYKFWSNVIYNPTIIDCLVSCLQEFPTFYNMETFPNDAAMRELLETTSHKLFLTLARLIVSKETKEEFMTPETHGNLLYDYFLLTVPIMLDICQLYGRKNGKVVGKILTTAFKLQPAYNDDLGKTAQFLVKTFKTIDERFEIRAIPLATGAVPLSERISHPPMTIDNLEDLIIHLLDVASNVSVFLDCFPPANDLLRSEHFINQIVHQYGNTIPEMYKSLELLAYKDETIVKYAELKHRLDAARSYLLKIFRSLTYNNIANILDSSNPSQVPGAAEYVEQFINYLEKAVSEREFMLDYCVNYSIEDDLDLVSQISHDIDPVKRNFIERFVWAEFAEIDRSKDPQPSRSNNTMSTPAIPSGSQQTVTKPALNDGQTNEAIQTNVPAKRDPDKLTSSIKEVKDILCDLGEGFIERCLVHYNYDVNAVINAVFEDSLPENLKTLDRSLPYIPPDPAEASVANDRILGSERINVFDNDEFDVMTRDTIDKSRVHKGKRKDKYKRFDQLLDDKSYRQETRDIYQNYSMVPDDYEDEYDDTYDSHDVGPRGGDEQLEMDGRVFTTPRVLCGNEKREGDDENDEEDGEDTERNGGSSTRVQNDRLNFVQDPAEIRARAEQRRQSKRGGGGGASGSRGSQADVVGKPKGQGNDKNVLMNRDRKNTNKAARGNHNRRSGAEYKRRQGMLP